MSFILQNKKLINELIKVAQPAPETGMVSPDYSYLTLSNKLVDNLISEYSGQEINEYDVSAASNVGLGIEDLNNIGNFFDFLDKNQVTIGGERILYSSISVPENLDQKKWVPVDADKYTVFMETMNDETQQRSNVNNLYYVSPELLSKYILTLNTLTAKEHPETQKLIKSLLGGLISRINSMLKLKLTTDNVIPKPGEQPAKPAQPGEQPGKPSEQPGKPGEQPTKPTQPGAQQPSSGGGAVNISNLVKQMALALPFDDDDINFERISNFLEMYKKLAENSKNPTIMGAMSALNAAEQNIKLATQSVSTSVITFAGGHTAITSALTNKLPAAYHTFLQRLIYIIDMTSHVVNAFYNAYAKPGKTQDVRTWLPSYLSDEVRNQSTDSYSIAVRNKNKLDNLIKDLKSKWG